MDGSDVRRSLNIVLYSHTFLPSVGGRELVVHYLAQSLQHLGHRVRVVGPKVNRSSISKGLGYPIFRFSRVMGGGYGRGGLKGALSRFEAGCCFGWNLLRSGADVIHAHTTFPTGFLATKVGQALGDVPVVITPHGVDIHTIPELGHGKLLKPIPRDRIHWALEKCDALTAISKGMEHSLLSAGVKKEKITRIANGVDLERFSPNGHRNLASLEGMDEGCRLIVTVGNYHPRKGHEVIIKAMEWIVKTHADTKLVIVGRGTDGLLPLIRDCGLQKHVILTGAVALPFGEDGQVERERDLLAAIYSASSLYVSAGTQAGAEGLSLALLEAMAAGLPIVATRIAGNEDVVVDGQNGFLVEPSSEGALAQRINDILSRPEQSADFGRRSLSLVQRSSWNAIAELYVDLYQRIITSRAG